MYSSILQFQTNIGYVRDLSIIYSSISGFTASQTIDLSDLLRSQILMCVSALDHFVHNTVEEGMLEIYQGIRPPTSNFENFKISMKNHQYAKTNPHQVNWLRAEIKEKIRYDSFQKSKKIASAISLVTPKDLWNELSTMMGKNADDIKRNLDVIVTRRHNIAHAADSDPSNLGQRFSITKSEVDDVIDFVDELGNAIFQIVK